MHALILQMHPWKAGRKKKNCKGSRQTKNIPRNKMESNNKILQLQNY